MPTKTPTKDANGLVEMAWDPITRIVGSLGIYTKIDFAKNKVAGVEGKLRSGDIIGIISRDRSGLYSTSHVGLALRTNDGLHFMHASSPGNSGRVVVDTRISKYLARYRSDSGILVARPLK